MTFADPDDEEVIELSYEDLRERPLDELLELLDDLGISTEGVDSTTAALTQLVQYAE